MKCADRYFFLLNKEYVKLTGLHQLVIHGLYEDHMIEVTYSNIIKKRIYSKFMDRFVKRYSNEWEDVTTWVNVDDITCRAVFDEDHFAEIPRMRTLADDRAEGIKDDYSDGVINDLP